MTDQLRVLVLGGTSWLGGATARLAVERGHEVTCLARGEAGTAPEGVTFVRADRWREGAYDAVAAQDWDAVIDVGRQPETVRSAVAALGERTRHLVFVSTCSVYADDSHPGEDESAATHEPWNGAGEAPDEAYGPAKVACENVVLEGLGAERCLVARAGLIVGHGDPSDRFGYWPGRVAYAVTQGRPVLVPADPEMAVQVIDVLDLAAWLALAAEERTSGVYNALGDTFTMSDVLARCASAAGGEPTWVPAEPDWLTANGVEPWGGPGSLPLWLPMPDYAGFMTRSNAAARQSGLTLRPLDESIADSLRWERERGLERERRAGLSPEREQELTDLLRTAR